MPHLERSDNIEICPLGESFVAEIKGVDFSKPVPDAEFQLIKRAVDKVRSSI